jgi:hypothetical protein
VRADDARPATVEDVHTIAQSMPHVARYPGLRNAVYQVGGKSFVFFRNPRPDAVDERTGERLTDVIVIWVPDQGVKEALVQEPDTPFFTTAHFDGHDSVLVQASRLGEVSVGEMRELFQEAWLCRASRKRANDWLREHGMAPDA